ncbi:hypothetical protein JAAARDRAFT_576630 [Jaapia argillacea MUCL 33604]|uniref:Uncharacterized protein n=1 Tax=Jaapia argillacea MUCL 33604 TaxID=933084 RepID=A0A067QCM1_9AGAM|nr:hypothetical protein JAAARDRAFT_576630 [Jaapia argillacea MUCL 33604]
MSGSGTGLSPCTISRLSFASTLISSHSWSAWAPLKRSALSAEHLRSSLLPRRHRDDLLFPLLRALVMLSDSTALTTIREFDLVLGRYT